MRLSSESSKRTGCSFKKSLVRYATLVFALVILVNITNCVKTQSGESIIPMTPTTDLNSLIAVESQSIPLTGEWRFSIDQDKVGEQQEWFSAGFDDATWTIVSAPHTWNVMPEYLDYEGFAWYRRTFTAPAGSENTHLRLRFEAVFYLARVWLNGEYLGQHEGGYTPFEFVVSALVTPGEENTIAVQVDNLRSPDRIPAQLTEGWSYDWWNYGGITRNVSLEITSRAYIARQQIVSIPHITGMDEADSATVTATITINNTSGNPINGTIVADLLEENNSQSALAAPVSSQVSVPAEESVVIELVATLTSPRLWHFDHPYLYIWSASLIDQDGRNLHTDKVTIGIRSVELKDGLFYLNGEQVRLVGVTRHADYPGQGSAETVTAMIADYDDLKALNEVLSRPVHYPQDDTVLDYADRHGILLIPEVPAWQLNQTQMNNDEMRTLEMQQINEMIMEDFNHPSVWAWSIGNEIESDTSAGNSFVQDMVAYVKSLDPTRPVGFATNRLGSRTYFEATNFSDFVLMNQYFGTWVGPKQGLGAALDRIHQTWPEKAIIISEYGFEPHWNELWGPATASLDADQYYFIPDGTPSDSEAADIIRRQLIVEQMAIFRSKPFVSGAIFWTYQDYRTRSNFIMGLVDSDRNRRGSWEVLRDEYAPALIDSLSLSPVVDDQQTATLLLHTRGPIEVDMPVYTLRGYTLHWAVTSLDGNDVFSEGDVSLPTLAPASQWSGEIPFIVPATDYIVTVSIIRPTGFSVTELSSNSQGDPVP